MLTTEKYCPTGQSYSEELGGTTTPHQNGLFHVQKYLERGLECVCFYYEYKIYIRHKIHLHIYNLPLLSSFLSKSHSAWPHCPLLPLHSALPHNIRFTLAQCATWSGIPGPAGKWLAFLSSSMVLFPSLYAFPSPQTSSVKTQEKRGRQ